MSDDANRGAWGVFLRHLVLPPVVLLAGLLFAGTASAQTAFQANVIGAGSINATCLGGQTPFCGTADIAGYGSASWGLILTSANFVPSSCDTTYRATVVFTFNSDGSTLVLNESGYGCGPGNDGNGFFKEGPNSRGGPNVLHGTWTVDTADSTGRFAGLTGSGTDVLKSAGAQNRGSYIGTLG